MPGITQRAFYPSSYLPVDETEARELVWVHTSGEEGQGSKTHI